MDEAIVDITLDFNPSLSECIIQPGAEENILTDNRDQLQNPSHAHAGYEAAHYRLQMRSERVEALRLRIASGLYRIDTIALAFSISRNLTHFLETY